MSHNVIVYFSNKVIFQHNTKQSSLILKLKAGLQESVHSHRALKARNDRLINEKAALEARLVAAGVKEVFIL